MDFNSHGYNSRTLYSLYSTYRISIGDFSYMKIYILRLRYYYLNLARKFLRLSPGQNLEAIKS